MNLGTILPTPESLAINDRYARNMEDRKVRIAFAGGLHNYEARTVGGERRYYYSATKYAVVSNSLRVLWFETRNGQDFSVAAPIA